jgi:flavin-dependent thymidylate synthase
MLAENGHETPFEKSSLHFLVTVDAATHIHLLKHRIGVSINGESARYKELRDDKYYLPNDWSLEEQSKYIAFMEDALMRYHDALERFVEDGMSRKRAKESARFYLPYGNQITMDIMFNWRSFHHFLELRMKPDAQREVRELSEKMLQIVRDIPGDPFKHTLEAFGYVVKPKEIFYHSV